VKGDHYMNNNEVKSVLEQYRDADKHINLANRQLEDISAATGFIPLCVVEEQERLKSRLTQLMSLKISVRRALERLDKTEADIIQLRSIEGLGWIKCACTVSYSIRQAQKIHKRALPKLGVFLEQEGTSDHVNGEEITL